MWTINTKTHPGARVWVGRTAVRVNGHAVPYLRNSRFEATRAERLLSAAVGFPVAVRPALVFLTGTLIPNVTIKQAPDGVAVLDRMDIPRAFRRASPMLTPEHVASRVRARPAVDYLEALTAPRRELRAPDMPNVRHEPPPSDEIRQQIRAWACGHAAVKRSKARPGDFRIRPLTCTSLVAGAGFEPATSGL